MSYNDFMSPGLIYPQETPPQQHLSSNYEIHRRPNPPSGPPISLDRLGIELKNAIDLTAQGPPPKCTSISWNLEGEQAVPLMRPSHGPYAVGGPQDLPIDILSLCTYKENDILGYNIPYLTIEEALSPPDRETQNIVQRAASRGIMQLVERIDDYKYAFNNGWTSKGTEGFRYTYMCQDSVKVKERFQIRRKPAAPVYNCKGSISVKFNAAKGSMEVAYVHCAIHPTVSEKRPAPGVAVFEGFANANANTEATGSGEEQAQTPTQAPKRKRNPNPNPATRKKKANAGEPSLADLLKANEAKPSASTVKENGKITQPLTAASPQTSMAYELPSWERPSSTSSGPQPAAQPPKPSAPYVSPYQPTQVSGNQNTQATSQSQGTFGMLKGPPEVVELRRKQLSEFMLPWTGPAQATPDPDSYQARFNAAYADQAPPEGHGLFLTLKANVPENPKHRPGRKPAKSLSLNWQPPGESTTAQPSHAFSATSQRSNSTPQARPPPSVSPPVGAPTGRFSGALPLDEDPMFAWREAAANKRDSPDPWFPSR